MVSILTALGTALLLPRTRWADLGDQLIAVLGFFQNWQLASTASDYLAADGSVTPLQHLWSMAVQGQFYLLAIALVSVIAYLASRVNPNYFRPSLAVTLLILTAGSFSTHSPNLHVTKPGRTTTPVPGCGNWPSVVCWPF